MTAWVQSDMGRTSPGLLPIHKQLSLAAGNGNSRYLGGHSVTLRTNGFKQCRWSLRVLKHLLQM